MYRGSNLAARPLNRTKDGLLESVHEQLLAGEVAVGMESLLQGLCHLRLNSESAEWTSYVHRCQHHPLRDLIYQDPFTYHAFSKPRGYPGDAPLLDYIYGVDECRSAPEDTTELGRRIFDYTTHTPATEGVRARARFVAETVDRLALEVNQPEILSVAAGHLREAGLSGALRQRKIGRWVAFDADARSLAETQDCYGNYGVTTAAGTVRQVLSGRVELGEFDLIYSTGLLDYLQRPLARRLVNRMFQMVRPGGRILVANFLPNILGIGYMESYMDWRLIYRSHGDMLDLAMSLDQSQVKDIRMLAEDQQNIVILQVTRK